MNARDPCNYAAFNLAVSAVLTITQLCSARATSGLPRPATY